MQQDQGNKRIFTIKNVHLISSVLVIIPVAIAYGVMPGITMPMLFDFPVETVDLTHVFRAVMGLYFAIAGIWIAGIFNPQYWKMATIVNIIFMGGLAAGRMTSLLIDGIPSLLLWLGCIAEAAYALWGYINLKKYT
jgi:Domain of unknown function (DUF4345)